MTIQQTLQVGVSDGRVSMQHRETSSDCVQQSTVEDGKMRPTSRISFWNCVKWAPVLELLDSLVSEAASVEKHTWKRHSEKIAESPGCAVCLRLPSSYARQCAPVFDLRISCQVRSATCKRVSNQISSLSVEPGFPTHFCALD